MSYSGGSNFRIFVILLFRGVFFFANGRKKNEVKSRPHSGSRPRIWVIARPFRRQLPVTSAFITSKHPYL